ncbi:DUF1918 domain-containing protein [Actinokineospora sp. HUAS TT18]|uniref:DUF1918 domain-containing protein n=1 Tax=Actinokineospora sp. HUAS TT18 TaxID=3447451 RepID=UPI003F523E2F
MYARPGDWLIVERGSVDHHPRRGRIEQVLHPDGSPPYVVRWTETDKSATVFPGPDARVMTADELDAHDAAALARFGRVQQAIRERSGS